MKPFLSLMLAVAVGCVIALSAPGSRAQEQEKPGSIFSSFKSVLAWKIEGACVVLTTDEVYVTLDNPTVRALGERVFLVGPLDKQFRVMPPSDLAKVMDEGSTIWIPVDSIIDIGQPKKDE